MATAQEILNLTILAEMCRSSLAQKEMTIEVIHSLNSYEARLAAIGKSENHKVISTSHHDFTPDDAFGVIIQHKGEDIGGVAARLLRLGTTSLSDYWRNSSRRLYGEGEVDMIGRITRAADQIRGRVVYEGELYISSEYRGHQVNLTAVMFYLHVLSVLTWKPDWLYGFIRMRHVSKVGKYGFSGFHVGAQEWLQEAERRNSDECLVTLEPSSLHDAIAHYIREPHFFTDL